MIYLTEVLGICFKSAVFNLCYQKFSSNQMTKRRITLDNNVKYLNKCSKSENEYSPKGSKPKTASLPEK